MTGYRTKNKTLLNPLILNGVVDARTIQNQGVSIVCPALRNQRRN